MVTESHLPSGIPGHVHPAEEDPLLVGRDVHGLADRLKVVNTILIILFLTLIGKVFSEDSVSLTRLPKQRVQPIFLPL